MTARFVTGTAIHDHITPVFKSLHWLAIKFRILFKLLLLTYKCVHNLTPPYLCSLMKLGTRGRVLRSNGQFHLVPCSRLVTYGDRSFCVAGPREWNKLPLALTAVPTVDSFKLKLKKYLFNQCYC